LLIQSIELPFPNSLSSYCGLAGSRTQQPSIISLYRHLPLGKYKLIAQAPLFYAGEDPFFALKFPAILTSFAVSK
jgi:hypothetical protein